MKLRFVLATAVMLAFGAPPAAAQQDWRPCAAEGGTCAVDGDTLVRFGAAGRYVFRTVRETVECTVEAFGSDPAPGTVKQCDTSRGWRADPQYRGWRDPTAALPAGSGAWRFCAVEGGDCVVKGATRVRFGADSRYQVRSVQDRVVCNISTFGDPAPGTAKVCEYEEGGAGWVPCANEGDLCRIAGTQTVRYGANGRYVERSATGGIACTNAVFGDPIPGLAKQCEVRGGAAARLPWEACAREGAHCTFRGPGMLRYGVDGRYAYREAVDGLACRNEEFGGDPAPGVTKRCELLRVGR